MSQKEKNTGFALFLMWLWKNWMLQADLNELKIMPQLIILEHYNFLKNKTSVIAFIIMDLKKKSNILYLLRIRVYPFFFLLNSSGLFSLIIFGYSFY